MRNKIVSLITCLSLALALSLASLNTAVAHAELEGAIPAPNSTVTESPKQLKLVFSEKIQVGTSVSLTDPDNKKVELADAQLDASDADGRSFVASVPVALAAGKYTVNWRSLSDDGHTEKGSYAFTVAAAAPAATATAAPTSAPTAWATLAPTAAPTATPAKAAAAAAPGNTVTFNFALKAGKDPVSCGKGIAGLGSRRNTAQITDARFYVSNVRLLTKTGQEVTVTLASDGKWQSSAAALVDFENATGKCKDGGTAEINTKVIGTVPTGTYTGVAFQLGIPFEYNHADVATAVSPLNVQALWWNWQSGYKFARIDLKTNSPAPNDTFLIHLGSTGCGEEMSMDHAAVGAGKAMTATTATTSTMQMDMAAGSQPPGHPCKNANAVQVRLNRFDPAKDVIVADLSGLLAGVNVAQPKPQPAGCMSGVDDPDCVRLFPNFGLSLKTGLCVNNCAGQKFFRVEAALKP